MFKRLMQIAPVVAVVGAASSAFATDPTVEEQITTALSSGATTANALLVAGIAISLAFLVFKIGKRVLGKV